MTVRFKPMLPGDEVASLPLFDPSWVAAAYYGLAHHGGDVTVESSLGIGTTFVLSLPMAEQESIDLEETGDHPVDQSRRWVSKATAATTIAAPSS